MTTTPHAELLTAADVDAIFDAHQYAPQFEFRYLVTGAIERALLARLGEQQPVAWMYEHGGRRHLTFTDQRLIERVHEHFTPAVPLYAHPPAAQPVAQGEREAFEAELQKMPEWAPEFEQHRAWVEHFAWLLWQARAARSAAQGAAQVPAGWRLVPVEPTDAMLDATTTCHKGRLYPQDSVHGPRAMRRREYVAMLSAAPSPAGERTSTEGDAHA